MRISDWSSDVCSSDLLGRIDCGGARKIQWPHADLESRTPRLVDQVFVKRAMAIFRHAIEGEPPRVRKTGFVCVAPEHATEHPRCKCADDGGRQGIDAARWRRRQQHHRQRLDPRSEEHTSELQSLMRISYAVFCLKKKNKQQK